MEGHALKEYCHLKVKKEEGEEKVPAPQAYKKNLRYTLSSKIIAFLPQNLYKL